ncbi:hypothetical protein ANN_02817 [Periplaneta americana]|uniref:RWP-RK domain-containing protein n=1 Tax=Periplaneta americana TaxID=6978 RepID=A0ABQ8U0V4_PERAM|nr:hypothetical protein ANN_02817 [Periplaneta americana]
MGPVPTQHRDAFGELTIGSEIRLRMPAITAGGDHRANHTIPPFWLDDRPPLLRHVGKFINLADKFRATECTERKKSVRWPTKVTEDAVEDATRKMQRGRNKSLKKLSVEIGVSYGSAHKILRNKLGKRPVGRPLDRWEDIVQEDTISLLQLRNRKVAGRDREEWRERIGKDMALKRAEEP